MLYSLLFIDNHAQGIDTDFHMLVDELLCDECIAFLCFHSFRYHRLIGNQQQGTGRNVVGKSGCEQGCRFHVHCHGTCLQQILFEVFIVLPDTAVGCINRTSPVVARMVADSRRNGTLKHKCRQGRNLGRIIVV